MSLQEQLRQLYRANQYEDICALYDRSPEGDDALTSEWDYVFVMNSLCKQQRYQDGLALYKNFVRKFPKNDKLDNKMGWCVYYQFVKPFNFAGREAEADNRKKVEYVLSRVKDGKYAPIWKIVHHVTKGILDRQVIHREDYSRCSWYLECVDRSALNREEGVRKDDGKSFSSDYEMWFSRKTKCLMALQAYNDCIRLCDEGLRTVPSFHGNTDSWLRARKAYCLLQIGRIEEAKDTAAEILDRGFNNWNIYALLFDIAAAGGEPREAMKYAGYCALADAHHEMRVNFYVKYAAFLDAQDSQELAEKAMLHRRLAVLLREERDWRIKCEDRQGISDEVKAFGKNEVLFALRRFWETHRDFGKNYVSGTIVRIVPEKKHGWVQDEKGRAYYFRFRDAGGPRNCLQAGNNVLFVIGKRMDPKSEKPKECAVEVKVLSNRGAREPRIVPHSNTRIGLLKGVEING